MKKLNRGDFIMKDMITAGDRAVVTLSFNKASDIELKALGDMPEGYVAGWASTSDVDFHGHMVKAGAFLDSIKDRGLTGPRSIKLLHGHDWNNVCGVIKVLEYRQGKLWIEAQIDLRIGYARDLWYSADISGGLSFSVGFSVQEYTVHNADEKDGKEEWYEITKGDLMEVSITPFPANEKAVMTIVKDDSELPKTVAEFEKLLVNSGLVKSRNDASRIVVVIKKSLKLFAKKEEPTPPMLALSHLNELSTKMAELLEAAKSN